MNQTMWGAEQPEVAVMVDKVLLQVGTIIHYRLRPEQNPVNPTRIWRGKIIRATFNEPYMLDHVQVELLDEGYEGEQEIVYPQQIAAIE